MMFCLLVTQKKNLYHEDLDYLLGLQNETE